MPIHSAETERVLREDLQTALDVAAAGYLTEEEEEEEEEEDEEDEEDEEETGEDGGWSD
jgi:hypothetical protein